VCHCHCHMTKAPMPQLPNSRHQTLFGLALFSADSTVAPFCTHTRCTRQFFGVFCAEPTTPAARVGWSMVMVAPSSWPKRKHNAGGDPDISTYGKCCRLRDSAIPKPILIQCTLVSGTR